MQKVDKIDLAIVQLVDELDRSAEDILSRPNWQCTYKMFKKND